MLLASEEIIVSSRNVKSQSRGFSFTFEEDNYKLTLASSNKVWQIIRASIPTQGCQISFTWDGHWLDYYENGIVLEWTSHHEHKNLQGSANLVIGNQVNGTENIQIFGLTIAKNSDVLIENYISNCKDESCNNI